MSIDEQIKRIVKSEVKKEISEVIAPLEILTEFADVDQLTIEEVCKVFRRDATEAAKNWIRECCKRGEIPHVKLGDSYLFPKRQIILLLCGEWQPEKKERKSKSNFNLREVAQEFVQ
jgi:hypothetical protein